MSIELKIKSKHLALEPAIIRKEEKKLLKQIKNHKLYHQIPNKDIWVYYKDHPDLYKLYEKHGSLVSHRVFNVRNEARATYLARAYLKGMPYKVVESKTRDDGLCNAVSFSLVRMVLKYGTTRYSSDVDRSVVPFKTIKTAEAKAWEDIKKWLEQ
jgi:hypothetical protein